MSAQRRPSSASEEELFEVEKILGRRRRRTDRWEYLIKWKGYDAKHNSWEPAHNLVGCSEAIRLFDEAMKNGKQHKKESTKKLSKHEEKQPGFYKILHMTGSPPLSSDTKKRRHFSEYKCENEEKPAPDKHLEEKKSYHSLKILATILFFLLLIFALVQPVGLPALLNLNPKA